MKMKTAEHCLEDQDIGVTQLSLRQYEGILKAMKAFASQAIDECAEEAETKDIHEGKNNYMSHMVVDRASILKVKELLK